MVPHIKKLLIPDVLRGCVTFYEVPHRAAFAFRPVCQFVIELPTRWIVLNHHMIRLAILCVPQFEEPFRQFVVIPFMPEMRFARVPAPPDCQHRRIAPMGSDIYTPHNLLLLYNRCPRLCILNLAESEQVILRSLDKFPEDLLSDKRFIPAILIQQVLNAFTRKKAVVWWFFKVVKRTQCPRFSPWQRPRGGFLVHFSEEVPAFRRPPDDDNAVRVINRGRHDGVLPQIPILQNNTRFVQDDDIIPEPLDILRGFRRSKIDQRPGKLE